MQKKRKKSLSSAWAENLAEGWRSWTSSRVPMRPVVSTSTFSARRSKITVEETFEDLGRENTETCQKLHGPAIVASATTRERRWSTNRWLFAFVKEALNLCRENFELGSTCIGYSSARMKAVRRTKPMTEKKQGVRDKSYIGSWLSSYRWRSCYSLKGF